MSNGHEVHDVLIIGAGPAGVSAALSLRDVGLRPLLIDRAADVGSSWRARYDRLRLNTGRRTSHLPGRPYPVGTAVFPTRDQVVAHLEHHAGESGIEQLLGTTVTRVDRDGTYWRVDTSAGRRWSRQVVVATGYEHTPVMPNWPGLDGFDGAVLHSSAYRNAEPFRDGRVLVVGAGSSGMEIVYDLAVGGVDRAWLAVRTPPNIMLRALPGGIPSDYLATPLFDAPSRLVDPLARLGGRITVGDLSAFGLPTPSEGVFARGKRQGRAPVIVDREVIDAIRAGAFEVVPTIAHFDADGVTLIDGRRLDPDVVICATGYHCGLGPILGHLGVLGADGHPRTQGSRAAAPGLRFLGFQSRPGLIGRVARESRAVARCITAELAAWRDERSLARCSESY